MSRSDLLWFLLAGCLAVTAVLWLLGEIPGDAS
jgi:hypothetical protein